jgi:Helix-turn-helix domain
MSMDERERETVFEQMSAFLAGEGEHPDLDGVPAELREELETMLEVAKATRGIDLDFVPDFEEDPVAVRFGFRPGPVQTRIAGESVADLRRELGASAQELATAVSERGYTVDEEWIHDLESAPWTTIPERAAHALADALGVDQARLGRRPAADRRDPVATVAERLVELDPALSVTIGDHVLSSAPLPRRQLVASYLDLRVWVFVLLESEALPAHLDAAIRAAGELLRSAADTSAVAVVAADTDLSTLLIDPSHLNPSICVPSGWSVPAGTAVTAMPLELAFRAFLQRMIPRWDSYDFEAGRHEPIDLDAIVRPITRGCIEGVNRTGHRARVEEKKVAYQSIGDAELEAVIALAEDAHRGALGDVGSCQRRIEQIAKLAS